MTWWGSFPGLIIYCEGWYLNNFKVNNVGPHHSVPMSCNCTMRQGPDIIKDDFCLFLMLLNFAWHVSHSPSKSGGKDARLFPGPVIHTQKIISNPNTVPNNIALCQSREKSLKMQVLSVIKPFLIEVSLSSMINIYYMPLILVSVIWADKTIMCGRCHQDISCISICLMPNSLGSLNISWILGWYNKLFKWIWWETKKQGMNSIDSDETSMRSMSPSLAGNNTNTKVFLLSFDEGRRSVCLFVISELCLGVFIFMWNCITDLDLWPPSLDLSILIPDCSVWPFHVLEVIIFIFIILIQVIINFIKLVILVGPCPTPTSLFVSILTVNKHSPAWWKFSKWPPSLPITRPHWHKLDSQIGVKLQPLLWEVEGKIYWSHWQW